jgi:small subunit ribosomal protein S14
MQKLLQKDKKRRRLFSKFEMKRSILKSMSRDSSLPKEIQLKCLEKLAQLPRDCSPVRLRNRCSITARSRGYLRLFRMSRITFREFAAEGLLPGVFKASW